MPQKAKAEGPFCFIDAFSLPSPPPVPGGQTTWRRDGGAGCRPCQERLGAAGLCPLLSALCRFPSAQAPERGVDIHVPASSQLSL